jgi:RNA polymerase sigma factor (sigma-70 family)
VTAAPPTDAQLVARCRLGDQAAWGELVERFSRYVYAIATQGYRLSPDDAEEVFQETFAKAFTSLHRLRDDEAFRGWIGQLTRRLCVDELRRRQRVEPGADELEVPVDDERLARLDEALSLRDALATLPESCREILDRFFARDESYAAIGEALELPGGTVASRISRCLGRLREAYEGSATAGKKGGGRAV